MMKPQMNYRDFLCNDLFIHWRVHPTKEMDQFWLNFIAQNENLKASLYEAIEIFDAIRNKQDTQYELLNESDLLSELKEKIGKAKRRKIQRILSSSVAAMLVLVLVSGLYLRYKKNETHLPAISSIGKVMEENTIRLISGNEILEIDNNTTLNLSDPTDTNTIQDETSLQKENKTQKSQQNTLIVPYGKRSTLILADGSKVYLNSGTKMEFPSKFSEEKREISVEGEIYIEVAKQARKPFIIHTALSEITVYGTSLNVSSYAEEESESVVLISGSVGVKSEQHTVLLQPNEMAEIENGVIRQKEVDVSEYIGWANGYMQFSRSPLYDVLKKIGRYYNITFQCAPELDLNQQTCSGKLFLSENPDDVLEAFSKMTYLQYEKKNDVTVLIHQ